MKIGFSNIACPAWDLPTLLANAKAYGYDGVELRTIGGNLHLPIASELMADPEATRDQFAEAGVELVCLSSSAAFHHRDAQQVAANKSQARDFIDAASALGCKYVRVFGHEIPRLPLIGKETRQRVLDRIAKALREIAGYAESREVVLLLENSGDFCKAQDVWFMCDAANSPAVRVCWNSLNARTVMERPVTAIPLLGRKIEMVHIADGKFDSQGYFDSHVPPGEGDCELPKAFELLRGMGYDRYLVVDWPKLWAPSVADADKVLPKAAEFLKGLIAQKPLVLSAYKGDKNAPKFRTAESV